MTQKIILVEGVKEQNFSLQELAELCRTSPDFIIELVEYDILTPEGERKSVWVFDMQHLQKIKQVLRLQHDLEINLAGAAVVLDLLEKLEELRSKAELLEKHLLR